MTTHSLTFITVACWLVPPVVAIALSVWLPFPRNAVLRCLAAIIVAWVLSVLLVALVYNPAAIALGHANGEHFPEARFDNNTVAVQLLAGWFVPAISVAAVASILALRRFLVARRRTHTQSSGEHT
jgi:hypothetical protein